MNDLYNSIDSPAATGRKEDAFLHASRQSSGLFLKQMDFLFANTCMEPTWPAIAVRGNPAARIVVAQFYDSLADLPFHGGWANKFKARLSQQIAEYFSANNVRVVNIDWGDEVTEFEQWLTRTRSEKDPAARKQFAAEDLQHLGAKPSKVRSAARLTPFLSVRAGNSNSNTEFTEDVPPSLHLPNLIAVGAVDQAGEETSFTSYGDTVVVYADGFQVESYVPGGTKLKFSGTSVAPPML